MDDKREAPPTIAPEERFKPAVMVCVPVGDDQRAQVSDRNLQDIQIAAKRRRRQAAVIEDRTPATVRLDRDQRREPMLCDELVTVAPVGSEVPAHALRPGHQYVNEVVDDNRDLSTIDRLEPNRPIGSDSHRPLTLQNCRSTIATELSPSGDIREHWRRRATPNPIPRAEIVAAG